MGGLEEGFGPASLRNTFSSREVSIDDLVRALLNGGISSDGA